MSLICWDIPKRKVGRSLEKRAPTTQEHIHFAYPSKHTDRFIPIGCKNNPILLY